MFSSLQISLPSLGVQYSSNIASISWCSILFKYRLHLLVFSTLQILLQSLDVQYSSNIASISWCSVVFKYRFHLFWMFVHLFICFLFYCLNLCFLVTFLYSYTVFICSSLFSSFVNNSLFHNHVSLLFFMVAISGCHNKNSRHILSFWLLTSHWLAVLFHRRHFPTLDFSALSYALVWSSSLCPFLFQVSIISFSDLLPSCLI